MKVFLIFWVLVVTPIASPTPCLYSSSMTITKSLYTCDRSYYPKIIPPTWIVKTFDSQKATRAFQGPWYLQASSPVNMNGLSALHTGLFSTCYPCCNSRVVFWDTTPEYPGDFNTDYIMLDSSFNLATQRIEKTKTLLKAAYGSTCPLAIFNIVTQKYYQTPFTELEELIDDDLNVHECNEDYKRQYTVACIAADDEWKEYMVFCVINKYDNFFCGNDKHIIWMFTRDIKPSWSTYEKAMNDIVQSGLCPNYLISIDQSVVLSDVPTVTADDIEGVVETTTVMTTSTTTSMTSYTDSDIDADYRVSSSTTTTVTTTSTVEFTLSEDYTIPYDFDFYEYCGNVKILKNLRPDMIREALSGLYYLYLATPCLLAEGDGAKIGLMNTAFPACSIEVIFDTTFEGPWVYETPIMMMDRGINAKTGETTTTRNIFGSAFDGNHPYGAFICHTEGYYPDVIPKVTAVTPEGIIMQSPGKLYRDSYMACIVGYQPDDFLIITIADSYKNLLYDDGDVNLFYVLTRQKIVPQKVIETINQEICRCGYQSKYLISIDQTFEISDKYTFESQYFEYSYTTTTTITTTESSSDEIIPDAPSPSVSRSIFPPIPNPDDSSPNTDSSPYPLPYSKCSLPSVPSPAPRSFSPVPVFPKEPGCNDPTDIPSPPAQKPIFIDPTPLPSPIPFDDLTPHPYYITPIPQFSPSAPPTQEPCIIDPKPLPTPQTPCYNTPIPKPSPKPYRLSPIELLSSPTQAPICIAPKPKTSTKSINYIAPKPMTFTKSINYIAPKPKIFTKSINYIAPKPKLYPKSDPEPVSPLQLPYSSARSSSLTQTSYSIASQFELPKICPTTWKIKTFDSFCATQLFQGAWCLQMATPIGLKDQYALRTGLFSNCYPCSNNRILLFDTTPQNTFDFNTDYYMIDSSFNLATQCIETTQSLLKSAYGDNLAIFSVITQKYYSTPMKDLEDLIDDQLISHECDDFYERRYTLAVIGCDDDWKDYVVMAVINTYDNLIYCGNDYHAIWVFTRDVNPSKEIYEKAFNDIKLSGLCPKYLMSIDHSVVLNKVPSVTPEDIEGVVKTTTVTTSETKSTKTVYTDSDIDSTSSMTSTTTITTVSTVEFTLNVDYTIQYDYDFYEYCGNIKILKNLQPDVISEALSGIWYLYSGTPCLLDESDDSRIGLFNTAFPASSVQLIIDNTEGPWDNETPLMMLDRGINAVTGQTSMTRNLIYSAVDGSHPHGAFMVHTEGYYNDLIPKVTAVTPEGITIQSPGKLYRDSYMACIAGYQPGDFLLLTIADKYKNLFCDDDDVNLFYVLTRQRIVPQSVIETIDQELCRCGYSSKYLISIDQTVNLKEEFTFEKSYFEYSYSSTTTVSSSSVSMSSSSSNMITPFDC